MKFTGYIIIFFLLFSANCFAQVTETSAYKFTDVSNEIKYYLTDEDYSKRDYDVIYPDAEQINHLRQLAKQNKDLFLEIAKNKLSNATSDKTQNLIKVLILASNEDNCPLLDLITPQNLNTVFHKHGEVITSELNRYLEYNYYGSNDIYIIETLVALKYYPAIPTILRLLNRSNSLNNEKKLKALIDLNASKEITEFVQIKILEELCDKNGYRVVSGIEVEKTLNTLQSLSEDLNSSSSQQFRQIKQHLIFEPREDDLIKFVNQAKNERLRGTGILLLAVLKSEAGLKIILEHLKTDSSELVRAWSAQCFVTHPNSAEEVVDALILAYKTDKTHDVRWASIESLGKISGYKAKITVREALNDKSQMIKDLAQRIINRIEKQSQ